MIVFTCGIISGERAMRRALVEIVDRRDIPAARAAARRSGFAGAIAASSSAFFTAARSEASSRSLTVMTPALPSRATAIATVCRRFSDAVVMPLLAKRV